jgi:tyrosyl-tRNA synthetase
MNKIIVDEKIIDEILSRSITEILPSKQDLKKELMSGRQMKLYIGADATGPALHIGHATNYIILEKIRKLGHRIILLIGDFTARIGDPTDKTAARIQLTRKEVLQNTSTWIQQLSPILSFDDKDNPVEIVYNHDWLSKMNFEDVIDLASNFTVQRMLERDMFEKRLKEEKPIYVHEFFYPLMQGYDSVHLDVDVEICGNDQKFNALCGRTLLQRYKQKEKFIIITTLLENPITKEKMMSKSMGTGVFLNMNNIDMYGKIMAQPDENIYQLFVDCTYESLDNIDKMQKKLELNFVNPKDLKMRLAFEITKIYHGDELAQKAEKYFIDTFQNKDIPADIKEFTVNKKRIFLIDLLLEAGLIGSKSEAKRIIEQNGIKIDGNIININQELSISQQGFVLQKGKRNFIKIVTIE